VLIITNKELEKEITSKIENICQNIDNEKSLEKINNFIDNLDFEDEKKMERINKGLSFYQRFKQAFESDVDIDPGRLLGLTDGIFGMVMTLLIFGMALPEIELLTAGDFINFIHSIMPTIGITLVSFILLSSFWIYHHEFIKVKNLNIPYLWLNIFYLACISFIPFSTSLVGSYSQFFLAEVIFGINIFLTLVFFLLMFNYANRRNFLENKPSEEEKSYIYNTLIIIMALTVVVNLLDFNISRNFIYLFFLVPVISTVRDITFKLKS